MAVTSPTQPARRGVPPVWIFPALILCGAYGLLGLTFVQHGSAHGDLMARCVLMNPNLSRIWSVGHVEISLSYFGVFGAMVFYFLRLYGQDRAHLLDLGLAMAYILGSFLLDLFCVLNFQPFVALLIGDAIVITFTVLVSRQLWFQRLLGVFVPLVFFTCGIGHLLEGLSYWKLTYPANVPWTMVTADIGFAILVNAVRFPAFIRGQDVLAELAETQQEAESKAGFLPGCAGLGDGGPSAAVQRAGRSALAPAPGRPEGSSGAWDHGRPAPPCGGSGEPAAVSRGAD